MSQALAQSATQLSISTPQEIDFAEMVERNAIRSVKGMTRSRILLNNQKLFSTCAEEYRSKRSIQKGDSLSAEVCKAIHDAVDSFIDSKLGLVNKLNCISQRAYNHHDMRNRRYTYRTQNTGEDLMTLLEQRNASTTHLKVLNQRLDLLYAKKQPNHDQEASVKEQIREAEFTRVFILAQIADMEKLTKEVSKEVVS